MTVYEMAKKYYQPEIETMPVEQIKALQSERLVKQVSSSVMWQQSVETMIAQGVDTFIEIGPGKTLSSFVKKINKEVTIINVDKYADLEKVKEAFGL